jgi:hypothetical protein
MTEPGSAAQSSQQCSRRPLTALNRAFQEPDVVDRGVLA